MPRNVLFVGDIEATTGFARVNEEILTRLDPAKWAVHVLGINASGDPHPIKEKLRIYPADEEGHTYGINRFGPMCKALKPACAVIHQDAWIVPNYLDFATDQGLKDSIPPVIAYCPPDAPNQPAGVKLEGRVARLLCPTQFGVRELRRGGYTGPADVLPYGVDTTFFCPGSRRAAREEMNFPERFLKGFVVGRADRNTHRKRYDLTLEGWRLWWQQAGRPDDAALFLHCLPIDLTTTSWDLKQLAAYYGIASQVLYSIDDGTGAGRLPPKDFLVTVMRTWNAHLSTTHGEGFGMVGVESAACGVMQIVPRYAAYGEWLEGAAQFMPISPYSHYTQPVVNTMGGVVRAEDIASALHHAYQSGDAYWQSMGAKALARATETRFNWDIIAREFERHLEAVCGESGSGSPSSSAPAA